MVHPTFTKEKKRKKKIANLRADKVNEATLVVLVSERFPIC